MSIGEAPDRTGLTPHTLRYYEREGLLAGPVPRCESGHRVYVEAHIEWLMMCKTLRASGMPLRAIARVVDLVKTGPGTEAERLSLLRDHQDRLTAEVAETQQPSSPTSAARSASTKVAPRKRDEPRRARIALTRDA